MTSYLILTVYEPNSELNRSDQITVPADVWTALDREHGVGELPIFVDIDGTVGRLRPAVPSDGLSNDSCRVPHWMWQRLGSPGGTDDESWVGLTVCDLPTAGTLALRARCEADITGSADPVAMLTEALSATWSCLTVGAELPLACGVFDIMGLTSIEGFPVPAACVLNCDVDLEIVRALDRPVTPEPTPEPTPVPTGKFVPFSGVGRRLGS